mmetsp:Transcript_4463/g.17572  ORF Transcript_4463/g.17572 Transcript_4463/m.17572 type:complete len:373 (-) Transcript_4463:341-1459(-)
MVVLTGGDPAEELLLQPSLAVFHEGLDLAQVPRQRRQEPPELLGPAFHQEQLGEHARVAKLLEDSDIGVVVSLTAGTPAPPLSPHRRGQLVQQRSQTLVREEQADQVQGTEDEGNMHGWEDGYEGHPRDWMQDRAERRVVSLATLSSDLLLVMIRRTRLQFRRRSDDHLRRIGLRGHLRDHQADACRTSMVRWCGVHEALHHGSAVHHSRLRCFDARNADEGLTGVHERLRRLDGVGTKATVDDVHQGVCHAHRLRAGHSTFSMCIFVHVYRCMLVHVSMKVVQGAGVNVAKRGGTIVVADHAQIIAPDIRRLRHMRGGLETLSVAMERGVGERRRVREVDKRFRGDARVDEGVLGDILVVVKIYDMTDTEV